MFFTGAGYQPAAQPPTWRTSVKVILCIQREGNIDFHWHAKLFELNFFIGKLSCRWSNQASRVILTDGQFAQCMVLNETPGFSLWARAWNNRHMNV